MLEQRLSTSQVYISWHRAIWQNRQSERAGERERERKTKRKRKRKRKRNRKEKEKEKEKDRKGHK